MGWFTRKERPTLGKMQETLQLREENFDSKIAKFDQELLQYKSQLKKLKPGTPAYQSVKQKAMGVLKKKKMYQNQRDRTSNQAFNLDQTQFAATSVKEARDTVNIMKATAKEIRKGLKKVDLGEVEDLHDDMEELLMDTEEIQEALGRTYEVGDIDEADLDGELEALEDDMLRDDLAEETPSYLKPREPNGGIGESKDTAMSYGSQQQKTEEEELSQLAS
ncbi:hypothetical protein GAYE_SCF03G2385 [Galdieria yellowstonensis]|uniref:Charged multivesicular body protein 5 n=1 Tax=Galdieria yellowstonensis TaxID=3028027 RepID=A0AAV9IAP2_9RHOD|nr:hypothetical protein GAYE_SCF03G2385 [Galdieria yellowstonensis]